MPYSRADTTRLSLLKTLSSHNKSASLSPNDITEIRMNVQEHLREPTNNLLIDVDEVMKIVSNNDED